MQRVNCATCKDNYLKRIYDDCINRNHCISKAMMEFDHICVLCKDPRSCLSIYKSITDGSCEDCKKYKDLYKNYIK